MAETHLERTESLFDSTSLMEKRQQLFKHLMASSGGDVNDEDVACIISSWATTKHSALPRWMGLTPREFQQLVVFHFGEMSAVDAVPAYLTQGEGLEIEWEDIFELLLEARAGKSISEYWIAKIISVACMARAHLWEDLGLWSRPTLTKLIARNFPSLAEQNSKNMRWKKFLFKQLCDQNGRYVCRAPSCEECDESHICFSHESDTKH